MAHRLIAVQTFEDARTFYVIRSQELDQNLREIEKIIQMKSNNLKVVENGRSLTAPRTYP